MIIRFCNCGNILSSKEIMEGIPCKPCRKRKGLKIPPLFKNEKKSNPAPNIWLDRQSQNKKI